MPHAFNSVVALGFISGIWTFFQVRYKNHNSEAVLSKRLNTSSKLEGEAVVVSHAYCGVETENCSECQSL